MTCEHIQFRPEVCDQTLGVVCLDCKSVIAFCWGEDHASENLWNKACDNDISAIPCEQDRDSVCAICGEDIKDSSTSCNHKPFSNRICEYGTKCCTVKH